MIQTTISVAVQLDLRGQYWKIIQPSGRNVQNSFAFLCNSCHTIKNGVSEDGKRGVKGWKERRGQVLYLWKGPQSRKRKKRNKKCLALLHLVLSDEAESAVQWAVRDIAGGLHDHHSTGPRDLLRGCQVFYFQSATIELNINKHFSLSVRRNIRFNKTANGVIPDVLNWLSQGVLYFNHIVRFHGTNVNFISFAPIGKARVFYWDNFHENRNCSTGFCS